MPEQRFPRPVRRLALAAGLVAAAGTAAAGGPDAARIAQQGNGRGAAPCEGCHNADGSGQSAAGFPRLAGLDAAYLRRQLDDFASGARDNPVMKPTASALSTVERAQMADYYSRMPVPAPTASVAPPADGPGRRLAERGRWQRQVPGCVQCHGPGGVGVGANFPPLAGQSATYIANQLRAWKQGTRHNDPLGLMRHVAANLDDADIAAVSAWFAAQPARSAGETAK